MLERELHRENSIDVCRDPRDSLLDGWLKLHEGRKHGFGREGKGPWRVAIIHSIPGAHTGCGVRIPTSARGGFAGYREHVTP